MVVTNCLLAVLATKLRVCLVSYFESDVVLLSPQRSSELLLLKPRIFFCMRYFSYLCLWRVTPCHISKLLMYVDHDLFCEADAKTDCGKL